MRVDQAFRRAGFEIVEATKENGVLTFSVRVPLHQEVVPMRWKMMMEHILVTAEVIASKPQKKWGIDIAKRFFSKNGVVRFLWRVQMTGDLTSAQAALVQAVLNALRVGNELREVPLIGQANLVPDPKNGKFKGAYPRNEEDRASQVVAGAFAVGTG